jgi:hypothetical protein
MLLFNPFPFSRRIVTDLSNPIMFILKIALLRKCLRENDDLHFVLKRFSKYLFFASLFTIIAFILLSRSRSIYIGLTPPIELPFVLNLLNGSYLKVFYALLLTLFSGKRSILLASIIVLIFYFFFIHKKYRVLKSIAVIIMILAFSAMIPNLLTSESSAVQKYMFTITTLLESEINLGSEESFDIIDRVSGGRFSEISYSLQSFSKLDYIFGKGPGYTYNFEVTVSDFAESDYSNVHFTPVNLFSKYGIVFTISFFYYLFSSLFKKTGNDRNSIFFKLLFTMYLIEMLFAFNIFVEPLIPFCMGYLTLKKL